MYAPRRVRYTAAVIDRFLLRAGVAATLVTLGGCAAVFPRFTTASRAVPAGMLEGGGLTPPPDTLHRLGLVRAECGQSTRDGRRWDPDGLPDLYVTISRNGSEVFRSRSIQDRIDPAWEPDRDAVDLFVREGDVLRIELRDDDGALVPSDFVGAIDFRGVVPAEARGGGTWAVRLEGGASVVLTSRTPTAHLGMGVTYEYRIESLVAVTVAEAGPAWAAGLRPGDRITRIHGTPIANLSELDVRQALDRATMREVSLVVERTGAPPFEAIIRVDALYDGR